MGLSRPAVAEGDHIFSAFDVGTAGKIQNQHLVQGRHHPEVEAVQALHGWKAGLTDAPLDQPPLAFQQFEFAQSQQITRVVDALGGTECRASLSYSRKKVGSFRALR
jgi:hypothetical protein